MIRRLITAIAAAAWIGVSAQTIEQTAGIYYCYPEPEGQYTAVPEDYAPVYISHYGRHGSRWVTDDKRYTDVMDAFADTTKLTPLGIDVYHRLQTVLDDAIGRSGSLSPVGERQHHNIAKRMYAAHPGLFAADASVEAVSSTSLRCAMSMSFFTESLKEENPQLKVSRTAYDKDMDYIAHTTPEGKSFSADTASWRKDYWEFVAATVDPTRLIDSLFADSSDMTAAEKLKLATGLYWIASDMQDIDLEMTLYDIFTYDELRSYWRCVNARMYMCNGNAPQAAGVMIHCADHLLGDILTRADSALATGAPAANLRFGHDTHLLRLLALMGIDGCAEQEWDMYKFDQVWRDYQLSPMAANLQMVFYKNSTDDVLVKILLNEREATLPLASPLAPYYKWNDVRDYLYKKIN